jgi:hypothetical protein
MGERASGILGAVAKENTPADNFWSLGLDGQKVQFNDVQVNAIRSYQMMLLLLCFKSITPLRGCCSSEPRWISICCSAARTMIAGHQAGHLLGHPCSLSISYPRSAPTSSTVRPDPCQHPRRSHPASGRRSASIRSPWKRRSTPPRG